MKVQHPGIAEAVEADLGNADALGRLARLVRPDLDTAPLVAELRDRVLDELDYQSEAAFQQAFCERYASHPVIRVPAVHHDWCRPRVLVSEYAGGRPFAEFLEHADEADRDRAGETIFRFVFGSLYRFRIFNADPHPGNYLFNDDGTVTFLDFGCTKTFGSGTRERLRRVHLAVMGADADELAPALRGAGILPERDDVDLAVVLDWFRLAHEPMNADAPYTYHPDYARRLVAASSDPQRGYAQELRKLRMPADYLMLQRIQFGVNSLLARVGPTANWRRIMAEYAAGEPPSTPLGEAEAAAFHDVAHLAA